ncbi:hypothetical protein DIDNDMLP_00017 [Klebsiella phage KP13-7]|nr:hypothetical protein DIDNDMLP_00017 [Klebsiella phage KP13-7]
MAKRSSTGVRKTPIKKIKKEEYVCYFCDKKFKRENTILTHKCVKRDRYNNRESRLMREALRIYLLFMKINHLPLKKDVEPLMYFIKSLYFNDFYDFANYILNNDILEKERFLNHIMTSGMSVQKWTTHAVLEEWVLHVLKYEHPERGVERSIMAIVEWSELTSNEWTTFFDNVSPARFIAWVESGKISPWLLWTVPPEVLRKITDRLSDSELEYIVKYIDPTYYQIKSINPYQVSVQKLKTILQDSGF